MGAVKERLVQGRRGKRKLRVGGSDLGIKVPTPRSVLLRYEDEKRTRKEVS